jgi:hypothetical protein
MSVVDTLRLFCSNVRGLVCNWSNATSFDWNEFDILAFNEIWDIKDYEKLKINGFEVKSCKIRQNQRGGGTIIFGRNDIKMKILVTPFIEGIIESTGVKEVGTLNFINVYRPPSGDKNLFVENMAQYLDTLRGQKVVIGGDFNLNVIGGNNLA